MPHARLSKDGQQWRWCTGGPRLHFAPTRRRWGGPSKAHSEDSLYLEATAVAAATSLLELQWREGLTRSQGQTQGTPVMRPLTLRPSERTFGCTVEPGTPGAPKCLFACRAVLRARRRTVLVPRGSRSASWSNVRHSPPALVMRARAVSVKRSAATFREGSSWPVRRMSSVIVPTTTATLLSLPCRANHSCHVAGGRWEVRCVSAPSCTAAGAQGP